MSFRALTPPSTRKSWCFCVWISGKRVESKAMMLLTHAAFSLGNDSVFRAHIWRILFNNKLKWMNALLKKCKEIFHKWHKSLFTGSLKDFHCWGKELHSIYKCCLILLANCSKHYQHAMLFICWVTIFSLSLLTVLGLVSNLLILQWTFNKAGLTLNCYFETLIKIKQEGPKDQMIHCGSGGGF